MKPLRLSDGPVLFFVLIFAVLAAVTIYLAPGWGFMDDRQCGQAAQAFWHGDLSWPSMIEGDMKSHGRFRPLYHLWVIGAYWVSQPLALYLLILVAGFAILLLWGRIIDRLFARPELSAFNRFLYPLTFFLFLPFWNVFMYISVQEKFVYIFGAISLWFLTLAYQNGRSRDYALSLVFAVLAILGKETGVAFLAAYAAFMFLDALVFRTRPRASMILLLICLALGGAYVLFIKGILGGYTGGYKEHLSVGQMVMALKGSSAVIKMAMAVALGVVIWILTDFFRGIRDVHPVILVIPFWVMIYVVLLLPWGFPQYLLAPLAPFVMMSLYYGLWRVFLKPHPSAVRFVSWGIVILTVFLVAGDLVPRISKMADKREVVEAIASVNRQQPSRFFYPPAYEETSIALEYFSGVKINYTGTISGADLAAEGKNFLVINDESSGAALKGVALGDSVYRSGTWLIREIRPDPLAESFFRLDVPRNLVQKFKQRVMSL